MPHKELLRNVGLFKDLDDSLLDKFAAITEEKNYESGETILDEGVEGDALYIIEEGQVEVTKTEDETASTIVTLEVNEHFGEMSLLEGLPTSARVSADGQVKLLVIPRLKFISLLDENEAIGAKVYRALAYALSHRLRSTSADLATWKPSFDF